MNANVSAKDRSERQREHDMVASPAVKILATTAELQPAGAKLSKARLNRFSPCSPREQNPGYSKYHWWNSEVNCVWETLKFQCSTCERNCKNFQCCNLVLDEFA